MCPAGFAVRCTAFLIDALIRLGIFLVCVALLAVIFKALPAAATAGKRIMGLQVLIANGLPLSTAGCLVRNLLRAVDFLPYMYALRREFPNRVRAHVRFRRALHR